MLQRNDTGVHVDLMNSDPMLGIDPGDTVDFPDLLPGFTEVSKVAKGVDVPSAKAYVDPLDDASVSTDTAVTATVVAPSTTATTTTTPASTDGASS